MLLSVPLAASVKAVAGSENGTDVENKYALLAGTCTYEYLLEDPGLGDYEGIQGFCEIPAWNEVSLWRDLLIDDYGWMDDHVIIQMNESFTKANFLNQIAAFKEHDSPDSLFLIMVITHGWAEEDSMVVGDEWDGTPIDGVDAWADGMALPWPPDYTHTNGIDIYDENFQPYNGDPRYDYANFITDDEFRALFDELAFEGRVVFVPGCCVGGGICEDLQMSGMLSIGVGNSDKHEMHFWPIHWYPALALAGGDDLPWFIDPTNLPDPDSNGDGAVSLEESYFWTVLAHDATDIMFVRQGMGPVNLYMFDGIEGETFL